MSFLNPKHEHIIVSGDGDTYHGITDTNGTAVVVSYDPSTLSAEAKSNEEDSGDITALVSEVEEGTADGKTYSIPAMLELVEYLTVNKNYVFHHNKGVMENAKLLRLLADVLQVPVELIN